MTPAGRQTPRQAAAKTHIHMQLSGTRTRHGIEVERWPTKKGRLLIVAVFFPIRVEGLYEYHIRVCQGALYLVGVGAVYDTSGGNNTPRGANFCTEVLQIQGSTHTHNQNGGIGIIHLDEMFPWTHRLAFSHLPRLCRETLRLRNSSEGGC